MDLDEEIDQKWGGSLRMKIQIDVGKPLKRGIFLESNMGENRWIPISYEKLLDFYYGCGYVGHTIKECDCDMSPGSSSEELRYGDWLREPPFFLIGRETASPARSNVTMAGRGRGRTWEGGRGGWRNRFSEDNSKDTKDYNQQNKDKEDNSCPDFGRVQPPVKSPAVPHPLIAPTGELLEKVTLSCEDSGINEGVSAKGKNSTEDNSIYEDNSILNASVNGKDISQKVSGNNSNNGPVIEGALNEQMEMDGVGLGPHADVILQSEIRDNGGVAEQNTQVKAVQNMGINGKNIIKTWKRLHRQKNFEELSGSTDASQSVSGCKHVIESEEEGLK